MKPLEPKNLPNHLAIIMDGNGRWAQSRGLPRIAGHRKGALAVRTVVTACRKIGINVLTLFSFSAQNWSRPSAEVSALMGLLFEYIKSERSTIMDNGIRLKAIGELDRIPDRPRRALFDLIEESSVNTDMVLCLALSYGGREEIVSMARDLVSRAASGEISPDVVDTQLVDNSLWSAPLGPVDLLVRTSGELRISNFLLWSSAYSELYFTEKMWPDFDEETLKEAIEAFSGRQRRFGDVIQ